MTEVRKNSTPRRRAWLFALAACAILYALAINNQWAIQPDSATYLAIGQSLADGRGMQFNGESAWSLPPLLPILIAVCRRLVGPDYWPINLAMKLFAVGAVALTYPLVRRLAGDLKEPIREAVALGSLLIAGTSARLFTDSTPILTDVPFLFFVTLALYSFVRGREGHWAWCLAGSLVMLVACATRFVGAILYGGMVLAMLMDFRRPGHARRILASLAGLALGALGGGLFYALFLAPQSAGGLAGWLAAMPREQWNAFTGGTKWPVMGEALLALPKVLFEVLIDQSVIGASAIAAALIAAGWVSAWHAKDRLSTVPSAAFVLFLVLLGSNAVATRYLLPLLPLLAYLFLRGTYSAAVWAKSRRNRKAETVPDSPAAPSGGRTARIALALATGVCIAVSLPKDFREIYWMHQPRFYDSFEKGRWRKWVDLGEYLRAHGRPGDVVGVTETSVVHYLSGLRVRTEAFSADGKPHSPHYGYAGLSAFPPEFFGRLMAESDLRFVVVPLGLTKTTLKPRNLAPGQPTGWSLRAIRSLEATGKFATPPRRFGDLALYERIEAQGAPGAPQPAPGP